MPVILGIAKFRGPTLVPPSPASSTVSSTVSSTGWNVPHLTRLLLILSATSEVPPMTPPTSMSCEGFPPITLMCRCWLMMRCGWGRGVQSRPQHKGVHRMSRKGAQTGLQSMYHAKQHTVHRIQNQITQQCVRAGLTARRRASTHQQSHKLVLLQECQQQLKRVATQSQVVSAAACRERTPWAASSEVGLCAVPNSIQLCTDMGTVDH